jgi:hypothetical protein
MVRLVGTASADRGGPTPNPSLKGQGGELFESGWPGVLLFREE